MDSVHHLHGGLYFANLTPDEWLPEQRGSDESVSTGDIPSLEAPGNDDDSTVSSIDINELPELLDVGVTRLNSDMIHMFTQEHDVTNSTLGAELYHLRMMNGGFLELPGG